jgi:hypothetical protein
LKNPQAIFGQCLFSLPGSRLRNLARAHLLSKLLLFVGDSKFMSPIVIGLQYYRAAKFAAEHAPSILRGEQSASGDLLLNTCGSRHTFARFSAD